MADKNVSFKISATDDASVAFAKAQRALKSLNEEAAKESSRRGGLGIIGRAGEDLKALKHNPTIEGFDQIGKLIKGGAAIAVATEAVNTLTEAFEAGTEAAKIFGKAGRDAAFGEVLGFKIPGVRFITRNVLGQETLQERLDRFSVEDKIGTEAAHERIAARLGRYDLAPAGTSTFDRAALAIEKNAVTQTLALAEKLIDVQVEFEKNEKSGLFQGERFRDLSATKNATDTALKQQIRQVGIVERNQRLQLELDERRDTEKRAKDAELKSVAARGEIRRKGLLVETQDARQILREQHEAELDQIRENTEARVEGIRQAAIAEANGKSLTERFSIGKRSDEQQRLARELGDAQSAESTRKANSADAAERERLLDKQFTTTQELLKAEQERLSVGDASSQLDAKRLEVAGSFNVRRKELLQIINDVDSTGAQRGRAFQEGLSLDAQQRLADQLLLTPTFHGSTAASNSSPFTTGQAEAAREKVYADPALLKAQKDLEDAIKNIGKQIAKAVEDAAAKLLSNIPGPFKALFGMN